MSIEEYKRVLPENSDEYTEEDWVATEDLIREDPLLRDDSATLAMLQKRGVTTAKIDGQSKEIRVEMNEFMDDRRKELMAGAEVTRTAALEGKGNRPITLTNRGEVVTDPKEIESIQDEHKL